MNIFLIGYRCTGKSTVGKRLAERLNWNFVDADEALVSTEGRSITQIVAQSGWDAFRRLEKSELKNLCRLENQVIATGGGVVLDEKNIELMKVNGPVIWLRANAQTIYDRFLSDHKTTSTRPSLTEKDIWDEIVTTLMERKPLYERAMSGYVNTDDKQADDICAEIESILNNLGYPPSG
jgi:shikimate kinase